MSPGEFRDLVYPKIYARWPFIRWTEETMIACAQDIGPVNAELAVQVVMLFGKEGRTSPPTGGQIYAKAMALLKDKSEPEARPRTERPESGGRTSAEDKAHNYAAQYNAAWEQRIGRIKRATDIVLEHERRGVLCDPESYRDLADEIRAALLRRSYDIAIQQGRFIGFAELNDEEYAALLLGRARSQHRNAVPAAWLPTQALREALKEIIKKERGDSYEPGSQEPTPEQPEALAGERETPRSGRDF